jgi:hypothetical protein
MLLLKCSVLKWFLVGAAGEHAWNNPCFKMLRLLSLASFEMFVCCEGLLVLNASIEGEKDLMRQRRDTWKIFPKVSV